MGRFSDPMAKEIGLRIRALREERGESQDHVADAIGIERASLSNIERGRHHPALRTTVALAEYFGVSLELLVLGELHSRELGTFSGKIKLLWEWLSETQKHQFIIQMAAVVLENTASAGQLSSTEIISGSTDEILETATEPQHPSH